MFSITPVISKSLKRLGSCIVRVIFDLFDVVARASWTNLVNIEFGSKPTKYSVRRADIKVVALAPNLYAIPSIRYDSNRQAPRCLFMAERASDSSNSPED